MYLTPTVMVEPCPATAFDDKVRAKDDLKQVVGLHEELGVVGLAVSHEPGAHHGDQEDIGTDQSHVEDEAVHQEVAIQPFVPLLPQVVVILDQRLHFPCFTCALT